MSVRLPPPGRGYRPRRLDHKGLSRHILAREKRPGSGIPRSPCAPIVGSKRILPWRGQGRSSASLERGALPHLLGIIQKGPGIGPTHRRATSALRREGLQPEGKGQNLLSCARKALALSSGPGGPCLPPLAEEGQGRSFSGPGPPPAARWRRGHLRTHPMSQREGFIPFCGRPWVTRFWGNLQIGPIAIGVCHIDQ